ncbi:MAG: MliC family protein [Pseudomonadota bacterium]|nr:MliC family protein [Pseudomonadota bacterium]
MPKRMTRPLAMPVTIAIVASTGCASQAVFEPDAPGDPVTYNCSQGTFAVTYGKDRETATLRIGVQTIVLDRTSSEAPAAYTAHGLSFWPEGKNNIFVKRNMSALYHNCSTPQ